MPHATEWLLPLMATVVFYGLAQALTKKLMSALPAGAFIVLYVGVKAVLGLGLYLGFASPQDSAQTARAFLFLSLFGNVINSLAWLFYFQAMERGAASIVGTITAAYPVVTVILAWAFLGEQLSRFQAVGVILVIAAGLLLAYEKDEPGRAPLERRSLVLAGTVFILWGVASAVYKAAFSAPFASTLRFLFHNAVVFSLLLFPYLSGSRTRIAKATDGKLGRLRKTCLPTLMVRQPDRQGSFRMGYG
jgi:transporter family protein